MLSEKERIWLRRTQQRLMFGRGKCPGGIQLHYTVRPLGMFGSDRNYIRFNEIELAHIQQTETEGEEGT